MSALAVYITGHGYGHATRVAAVLKALRARLPHVRLLLRTTAPRSVFEGYLGGEFEYEPVALDCGVGELDILRSDLDGTLRAWRGFLPREEELAAREADFLRREGAHAVYFDLPPLAAEVAARAGIPSIGVSNFSWDYIFADFARHDPFFGELAERFARLYEKTTLALELPLGHELTAFPRRRRVPLVANRSHADRAEVRRQLGLQPGQRAVLVALRQARLPGLDASSLPEGTRLLAFGELEGPGVLQLPEEWMSRFTDLLAACDAVLSKPGYGVASECIANRVPLLHLPRIDFAETEPLLEQLSRLIPQRGMTVEELETGRLGRCLEELFVLAERWQWRDTDCSGAGAVADILREYLV